MDTGQVYFFPSFLWTERNTRSMKTHKEDEANSSHLSPNKRTRRRNSVLEGQSRKSRLLARVANQNAAFTSSCVNSNIIFPCFRPPMGESCKLFMTRLFQIFTCRCRAMRTAKYHSMEWHAPVAWLPIPLLKKYGLLLADSSCWRKQHWNRFSRFIGENKKKGMTNVKFVNLQHFIML